MAYYSVQKRTAVLPASILDTCLVNWIIGLLCFFLILGINISLYFATIAEFPVPSEGKAATLWSQNRTLISGACFRQYTASVTTVRFGICSSVSREWTIAKELSCWKNWTGVKLLSAELNKTANSFCAHALLTFFTTSGFSKNDATMQHKVFCNSMNASFPSEISSPS